MIDAMNMIVLAFGCLAFGWFIEAVRDALA
jgi:hypothetical protein